ncbi:MAG: tRNA guanosine(34) transglycosylase Tgt [Candidatus Riflebacteria bacterium HGW-Riflebacteria-2]|jgi:queuine tRNA-ribosyltransferase|nr:MAG: tRNA guanosine(34) transglycosylase Tgt [Candidatus Riflebacteria bacterium HGW-Riflebacteria-2]
MNNAEFTFTVEHKSQECLGRAGLINTRRGQIKTPVFMPVGTAGTVKTLCPDELRAAGASIILGNTYHLMLRPGTKVLDHFGGLHNMMGWDRPMLTDSGGFQVFSLKKLNKITDEGVEFSSHIDGSKHWITPEESMRIQRSIGSEIIMVFDECCPYPAEESVARKAMERSVAWAKRCRADHPHMRNGQALFGIVQGSMYLPQRLESIERTAEIGFEGLAIGGLSVGEPKPLMIEILDGMMSHMPEHLPRYLMGVGTPEDLLVGVERGVDMFDCVHPTRIARHATVFTRNGRISLLNARWQLSDQPIDEGCNCYACRTFSRGYLRHLFKAREILGLRMASLHNVTFMVNLMNEIRQALLDGSFLALRDAFLAKYLSKEI